MAIKTEGRHPSEAILSEGEAGYSRDNVTIPASQSVLPNMLLGLLSVDAGITIIVAANSGNTGDGVLVMEDPATNTKAKEGVYLVTITEAASNAGNFNVEDPEGKSIGTGAVGSVFNKEVKFTLADGAADFIVGDQIEIQVDANPVTGVNYVPWDPSATDGSEDAIAFALNFATTGVGETIRIAAITRFAQLNTNCIEWPAGVTDAQKSQATDTLAAHGRGIIVR